MTIAEIIALVPEEKRGIVKDELSKLDGAIKVTSRVEADALWKNNEYVRAVVDAEVRRAVETHDEKFKTEKLPVLIDEELRKRNPPKDPRDIAVEEMRSKLTEMERSAIREKQRARAIGKLSERGIPDKLADFYLGEDDAATDAKLAVLFEHVVPWRDQYAEKTIKERFGTQAIPPAGTPPAPTDLRAQYEKAVADGNADMALVLQGKLQAMGRK